MSNDTETDERPQDSISRQYAEATGIAVGTHVDDPEGKGLPDYEPTSFPEAAEANDEAVKEREAEALEAHVNGETEGEKPEDETDPAASTEGTDGDVTEAPATEPGLEPDPAEVEVEETPVTEQAQA